jgi:Putative glutamine amidotransferase
MESHDTWKLVSLSPLPPWALVLLAGALAAGVVLAALDVRREALPRRRWLMWTLRALAGVCALGFLLEPGLRQLQVARVKNRVAVLVDRSASMRFPVAAGEPSRSQVVAEALARLRPQIEALKDRYAFEVQGFDPELAPITAEQLATQPPRGGRTDLLAALRALRASDTGGSRALAGVLLFSDGADNVDLAQGLTGPARTALEALRVPVSTVAVGQGGLADLSVDAVKVDEFAFVRNSLTAEVELHGRGFKGQTVPVVLRREGQVVATRSVTFTADEDVKQVSFTFTPDQTGRFVYTVSMPVYPEEAVAENNARSFALKVIRDRVRVLLVAGRPSWDERAIRGILRQDANVELISFYILRSSSDQTGVLDEQRELSLIPFPRDEIFQKKINTFDLIMVLNFAQDDPGTSLASYQRDIETYVRNGGALAYLGGDRSFGEAPSSWTPFDAVLPVMSAGPAEVQPFSPRLTPEGQRHPITLLATGSTSNEEAWAALPGLPGMNLTRPRPGAVVLLDHPFSTVDGKNAPLLAIWEVGRGRAMALMTDGTWYWSLPAHAGGAAARSYERFWSNAIRWLVRDPDLTTLSVTADPSSVEPGKPVVAVVVARLPDYQPAAGAAIALDLKSADDGRVVGQAMAVAGPDGVARLELPPPAPGAYLLIGKARQQDKVLGEATDAVAVRAVGPELADVRVNASLLKDLASATRGAFFESPDLSLSDVPLAEPPLVEVGRSKDQPLWDRWYWLVTMVMLLGLEWGVRRRYGYI